MRDLRLGLIQDKVVYMVEERQIRILHGKIVMVVRIKDGSTGMVYRI